MNPWEQTDLKIEKQDYLAFQSSRQIQTGTWKGKLL